MRSPTFDYRGLIRRNRRPPVPPPGSCTTKDDGTINATHSPSNSDTSPLSTVPIGIAP